jgi:hypothetical protein
LRAKSTTLKSCAGLEVGAIAGVALSGIAYGSVDGSQNTCVSGYVELISILGRGWAIYDNNPLMRETVIFTGPCGLIFIARDYPSHFLS